MSKKKTQYKELRVRILKSVHEATIKMAKREKRSLPKHVESVLDMYNESQ